MSHSHGRPDQMQKPNEQHDPDYNTDQYLVQVLQQVISLIRIPEQREALLRHKTLDALFETILTQKNLIPKDAMLCLLMELIRAYFHSAPISDRMCESSPHLSSQETKTLTELQVNRELRRHVTSLVTVLCMFRNPSYVKCTLSLIQDIVKALENLIAQMKTTFQESQDAIIPSLKKRKYQTASRPLQKRNPQFLREFSKFAASQTSESFPLRLEPFIEMEASSSILSALLSLLDSFITNLSLQVFFLPQQIDPKFSSNECCITLLNLFSDPIILKATKDVRLAHEAFQIMEKLVLCLSSSSSELLDVCESHAWFWANRCSSSFIVFISALTANFTKPSTTESHTVTDLAQAALTCARILRHLIQRHHKCLARFIANFLASSDFQYQLHSCFTILLTDIKNKQVSSKSETLLDIINKILHQFNTIGLEYLTLLCNLGNSRFNEDKYSDMAFTGNDSVSLPKNAKILAMYCRIFDQVITNFFSLFDSTLRRNIHAALLRGSKSLNGSKNPYLKHCWSSFLTCIDALQSPQTKFFTERINQARYLCELGSSLCSLDTFSSNVQQQDDEYELISSFRSKSNDFFRLIRPDFTTQEQLESLNLFEVILDVITNDMAVHIFLPPVIDMVENAIKKRDNYEPLNNDISLLVHRALHAILKVPMIKQNTDAQSAANSASRLLAIGLEEDFAENEDYIQRIIFRSAFHLFRTLVSSHREEYILDAIDQCKRVLHRISKKIQSDTQLKIILPDIILLGSRCDKLHCHYDRTNRNHITADDTGHKFCHNICDQSIFDAVFPIVEYIVLNQEMDESTLMICGLLFAHAPKQFLLRNGIKCSEIILPCVNAMWSKSPKFSSKAMDQLGYFLTASTRIHLSEKGAYDSKSMNESTMALITEDSKTLASLLSKEFKNKLLSRDEEMRLQTLMVFTVIAKFPGIGEHWICISLDVFLTEAVREFLEYRLSNTILRIHPCESYRMLISVCLHLSPQNDLNEARAIQQVFWTRKHQLLPFLLENILSDDTFLSELAALMDEEEEKIWKELPAAVLPSLIRSCDIAGLERLSQKLKKEKSLLILENLATIFPYCLSSSHVYRAMEFVEANADVTLKELMSSNLKVAQSVTKSLVMQLGKYNSNQALKGLERISNLLFDQLPNDSRLGQLLSEHFLLIMDALNHDLFMKEDLDALRALQKIIPLVGKNIHHFIPKLMATLKLAFEQKKTALLDETAETWAIFLNVLDPDQITPYLGSVFGILFSHLKKYHAKFEPIFTKIVLNCSNLDKHVMEIQFVLEQIEDSNKNIHDLKRFVSEKYKSGFDSENIEALLITISKHESHLIRSIALDKLLNYLQKSNFGFMDFRDKADIETAKRIATIAAYAMTDSSQACRIKALQCIGQLGAVDPMLFNDSMSKFRHHEHAIPNLKFCTEMPVNALKLAEKLLTDFLVPALRKGERRAAGGRQNVIGFSIQELLRVCGCSKDTPQLSEDISDSDVEKAFAFRDRPEDLEDLDEKKDKVGEHHGAALWKTLLEDIRTAVRPYLGSSYTLVTTVGGFDGDAPQLKWKSLGSSNLKSSSHEWLCNVSAQFCDVLAGTTLLRKALKTCRKAIKTDFLTASFCLPVLIWEFFRTTHIENLNDFVDDLSEDLIRACKFSQEKAQIVFSTFDTLSQWIEKRKELLKEYPEHKMWLDKVLCQHPDKADQLRSFGEIAISANMLPRATLYFEKLSYICYESSRAKCDKSYFSTVHQYLRTNRVVLKFFQQIYQELEDIDELRGVAMLREQTDLEEQIIDAEAMGNLDNALLLYEKGIGLQPSSVPLHIGYMQCLQALGQWESMLLHARGMLCFIDDKIASEVQVMEVKSVGMDAAWRLSRWDQLDEFCKSSRKDWSSLCLHEQDENLLKIKYKLVVGNLILSCQKRDLTNFNFWMNEGRCAIIKAASTAALGGYENIYPYALQSQCLTDLENMFQRRLLNDSDETHNSHGDLLIESENRYMMISCSLKVREPILSLRRVAFELAGERRSAAKTSLQLCKIARKSGNLRSAITSANRGDLLGSADAKIDMAKLLFLQGSSEMAVKSLLSEISSLDVILQGQEPDKCVKERHRLAKMHILTGRWIEETRSSSPEVVLGHYRSATEIAPELEKSFYLLGRFYDRLLEARVQARSELSSLDDSSKKLTNNKKSTPSKGTSTDAGDYVPLVIENYGQALRRGTQHLYEMLPRISTLWFEYGVVECTKDLAREEATTTSMLVVEAMKALTEVLPEQIWLTVVPQLVSRLLHPSPSVQKLLIRLLAKLLTSFPDQLLWTVVPVTQSRDKSRADVAKKIIKMAWKLKQSEDPSGCAIFTDNLKQAMDFIGELIKVCVHPANAKVQRMKTSRDFRNFSRIMPVDMIIPTQQALTSVLPDTDKSGKKRERVDRLKNPVVCGAETRVTFTLIEEDILLMSSLMKPKRLGIIGSDGKTYYFLFKREDSGDMRKDSRLMEFATVVNRHLSRDNEARLRRLSLRTYAVLPLNEECGILEWVSHLNSLRGVVSCLYSEMGIKHPSTEIKRAYDNRASELAFFQDYALALFPPVLHQFFFRQFLDPCTWLQARTLFSRSCAVWSIVGYVIGLGDRHGENVTIDTKSGECVHVDFACLFEKGLTLKVPEVVPFRLTQNMVDGMGVIGYDGSFRCCAEITARVLRENKDAYMSVLETYLHDPLVEWLGGAKGSKSKTNTTAQTHAITSRKAVERKLQGIVGSSLPLSIEGQVQRLIHDATNPENLSKMYIWWMPWI